MWFLSVTQVHKRISFVFALLVRRYTSFQIWKMIQSRLNSPLSYFESRNVLWALLAAVAHTHTYAMPTSPTTFLSSPGWKRDIIKPHRFTSVRCLPTLMEHISCLATYFWPPRQPWAVLKYETRVCTVNFFKWRRTLKGGWGGNATPQLIVKFFRKLHNKWITWSSSQDLEQILT